MSQAPLTHWQGQPVEAWRAAWEVPTVEAHARLGSTNDRALELAAAEIGGFAVVIADEQTEGRGRRGARWHSPPGTGLWMSAVLPSVQATPNISLLVGLAAAEAIEVAAGLSVGIKWPNDLMVGLRKVGGILCEAACGAVVAGIGLNLRTPEGGFASSISGRATSLQKEGAKSLSPSDLAGLIVGALKRRLTFVSSELDGDALAELGARDVLAARAVVTDEHGPGTARGIDVDGALILERPDGSRVRVVAGSVRPQ